MKFDPIDFNKKFQFALSRIALLLVALFLAEVSTSQAALIAETGNQLTTVKNCSLKIEGKIANGDAPKVEAILKRELGPLSKRISEKNLPDAEYKEYYIACLSGPGGSYLEGIKLGELFASYGIATVVPDNMACESACAVAFLGGRGCCDANGKPVALRYLFPGSRIGFHAPSLNLPGSVMYSRNDALQAYDLGLEAVARLRRNAETFSISDLFMSQIFSHREQNFYYINSLDDAEFNNILLTGFQERRLKKDTNQAACWNAWNWYVAGPGDFSFTSADDWKAVFQGPSGNSGRFVRGSNVYEFYPFDGNAYCLVREVRREGRRMLKVIISEYNVDTDQDPRLKGFFRPTILMRGNRTLESTR